MAAMDRAHIVYSAAVGENLGHTHTNCSIFLQVSSEDLSVWFSIPDMND